MKFREQIPFLLLFLLALSSAAQKNTVTKRDVQITIAPEFNGEKLVLETKKYLSPAGDTVQFERLRFYLSGLELILSDGTHYIESESYHLVDAENEGSLAFSLKGVPKGTIKAIRFNIGVDSLKSVSGAMDGDLDPRHGMYWAWNSGYINAKLEGRSKACKAHQNRFEFHIGGYAPAQNALRTVTLELEGKKATGKLVLTADVQSWFNGIELGKISGIMIPGKDAMRMADNYSHMFKVEPAP